MYADRLQQTVRAEIEPVLAGMGYALVELSLARRRGSTRAVVVVHRVDGVGVDQCAEVSRAVLPRLELVEGLGEVSLEVSSPGIERTIKDPREYAIFSGRGVRVLAGDGSDWIRGTIVSAAAEILVLEAPEGRREIPLASIRRARLDDHFDRAAGPSRAPADR